jgi:hypothetical protein
LTIHAQGFSDSMVNKVLDGEIDDFIQAFLQAKEHKK